MCRVGTLAKNYLLDLVTEPAQLLASVLEMIRRNSERKAGEPWGLRLLSMRSMPCLGPLGLWIPNKGANLGRERPLRRCVRPRMLQGRLAPGFQPSQPLASANQR